MCTAASFRVRAAKRAERAWIERYLAGSWGSATVVSRGVAHDASRLPALVAVQGEEIVGLATFNFADGECERRLWLITTNDNLDAIRFYQRRGMRLVAVHPGAVDEARRIKPSIPEIGEHGIPIRDELELELTLGGTGPRVGRLSGGS